MKRRSILSTIGVSVSAGFVGCSVRSDSPATSTADNESTDSPPISTEAIEAQLDIPSCPDRPDSFTRETAIDFAIQFEKAYIIQEKVREQDRVVDIELDIGGDALEQTATETPDGWIVRFGVTGPYLEWRVASGATETRHLDPPTYGVNYFISAESVHRVVKLEPVDPRDVDGSAVECPPR